MLVSVFAEHMLGAGTMKQTCGALGLALILLIGDHISSMILSANQLNCLSLASVTMLRWKDVSG